MSGSFKIIDVSNWKRKLHYQLFKDALQPNFSVCLELDITNFKRKVKENNWSFSLALIHTVTTCANEIEEFRYRFLNGDVALYETIHTSFTYLDQASELFKVIHVPMQTDIKLYMDEAKKTIENQKEYVTGPIANDVYQFSSLPWIKFTHFSHTLAGKSEKSNPMFDWGKYVEANGKIIIPFSIQVHHSFADGYHVGKFVEYLQAYLHDFNKM